MPTEVERLLHAPNFKQPWLLNGVAALGFNIVHLVALVFRLLAYCIKALAALVGAWSFDGVFATPAITDNPLLASNLEVIDLGGDRYVDILTFGDVATADIIYVLIPGNPGTALKTHRG
jgi:hypothetical protein